MNTRRNLFLIGAVVVALGLHWLGGQTYQKVVRSPDEKAVDEQLLALRSEVEASQPKPSQPEIVAETQPTGEQPPAVAFEPPFPDRISLFQAPRRQRRGVARSKGQAELDIELLGFINVDGQKVALSIDGLVTTAAEGDKLSGIEVISIQPPKVVLQRGRQRWQASFEN